MSRPIAECIHSILSWVDEGSRAEIIDLLESQLILKEEDLKLFTVNELFDKIKVPYHVAMLLGEANLLKDGNDATPSASVRPQRLDRSMLIGNRLEGLRSRYSRRECSMRKGTVRGLRDLILQKCAVLMQAPPQTGKTSMLELIMLDPESDQAFQAVYYISLGRLSAPYTFDQIWESDVGKHTSLFDLTKSPKSSPEGKHKQQASPANTRPNLLLVDEGHVGFGHDLPLWPLLKLVKSGRTNLRMLIVSAWGSHDRFQGCMDSAATPGNWGSDSVVGLWPTYMTPVSLQLPVEEATELWGAWSLGVGLSDSVRDHIFYISDRQPGLLTHVLDWLSGRGLDPMNSNEVKICKYLLSSGFYESLSSLRSIKKLNEGIAEGENAKCLRGFLRVLLWDCEVTMDMLSDDARKGAALALKWGQATECWDESRKIMKLPSRLHEIYFMKQLYQNRSSDVRFDGLLDFVMKVVERMNPEQLMNSVSWTVSDNRLKERRYQVEFYRAALTVLPRGSWLSQDAGKLLGDDGYIDFYLSEPYLWGFKLMRDGDKLEAHLNRFMGGGRYSKLLSSGKMKDYVILNFTLNLSFEHRVDSDEHLIHVVFRDDFKTTVLSGSCISTGSCSIPVQGVGLL